MKPRFLNNTFALAALLTNSRPTAFAFVSFVMLALMLWAAPSLAQSQSVNSPIATEQVLRLGSLATKRTSSQPTEEEAKPETLQYVRLSDLTGEGNTQYSYTPAKYDAKELREHLRFPANALKEGKRGRVDVVVYLSAEGTITHVNYIGEESHAPNDFARSACDAVKKCTFTPALRNNKPVHSVVVIPVRFIL